MTLKTLNDNLKFIDVTNQWLKNARPNTHKVLDSYYYISNDKIYIVDGSKNVVLDYSLKELEIANWIENTFGGEIYMNPRVNFPRNIKTADYWWNGEYWDLKELNSSTSQNRAIDNAVKCCKEQSHNFIFDITNCSIPTKNIMTQVELLFYKKKRSWINKVIVKSDNEVVIIYIRQ